jgi:CubicO group peptidase (beta-lactamase class C family)
MALSASANVIDITTLTLLSSFSGQLIPEGNEEIMEETPVICGKCDSRFLRVREAFAENFKSGKELGAAVAVTIDGRMAVDLWAGYADPQRTQPWEEDTLVNVYSTTKGMIAICVHQLVDRGLLDLDERIAHYWPEFAQGGKGDMPVRYLLNHRAGLAAINKPLPADAIFNWDIMADAIAAQEPWWEPGSRHGYHLRTYGWLVGEIVRRASGKESPGIYFRDEIAGPLGLDFHIGLDERHHDRVAFITRIPKSPPGSQPNLTDIITNQPASITSKAFTNPPTYLIPDVANTPEWRRSEIPSGNGHGTARAIARVYGALACGGEIDGIRLLSRESIERARTEESRGPDEVLILETRFGLGFMMPLPGSTMGPNEQAFGHPGAGGSLGFADPEAQVGFGYVMNLTATDILINERPTRLIDALYESL